MLATNLDHLTFPAARRHRKVRQWLAFVVVNGAGALLNYGIYALLVLYVGFFGDHPVAAVAVGSAVAFVIATHYYEKIISKSLLDVRD